MKRFSNFARWCVAGCAAVTTWVAVMPAQAQTGVGDVVYVPTPQIVVDRMLGFGKVNGNDYVMDLGSGDGVIVLTAARQLKASGMGIGAHESYQYVQELGGKISVQSELNRGTTVTLLLPLFHAQAPSPASAMGLS